MRVASLLAVVLLVAPSRTDAADPPKLELQKGDHICIVGNTLADRMQHDGWLESTLQLRFPEHQLVIRNLGFSGDEITTRLRSLDFGTPDQWLAGNAPIPQPDKLTSKDHVRANRFEKVGTNADVIFAFFGGNEAWAGDAGLPQFRKDLDAWVKHTLGQKYNGKSAPRLVLFSPTAFENHKSPNLPDGVEQNARLEKYTTAMGEVAKANGIVFVDLFHPTVGLYEKAPKPLTINGIHFNSEGNRELARVIDLALFPGSANLDATRLAAVREAVQEKNRHWFQRYRATDGYSVFGARAFLKFAPDQQSNYEVAQRELEIIDVLVSNRDRVIWAAAQGKRIEPDDSNTPPFLSVTTNKPGKGPGGKHLFLDGTEAIGEMQLAKGLKVNLFADEKQFPDLVNTVQMAFDPAGRLWVACWPTYPHWTPKHAMNDKLLVLEDTDGDGKADKCTTFAGDLHNPTGFEFVNGGVLVAQAPDLVFLKDTDGDGKADVRQRVIHGLDTADTHHTANSFAVDPGGAVYFQEGTFHHSQVETPYGPPQRVANGAVFRYEPRTQKFEVYVTYGFANPHGHAFDRWGQDIVVDGTGAVPFHAALFSGFLPFPQKHSQTPTVYKQRTRPCPGIEYLSSNHFPAEWNGNLIVANVIGDQGIMRYRIKDAGSSFAGEEVTPGQSIIKSKDPHFRPVDVKVGPDGALYFIDWHNPIIGHMQHNLRDPSRNRSHGRVYRVTYEGRELSKPVKVAGESIEKLLDVLKQPEDRVRHRARLELGARKTEDVVAAARTWLAGLDKSDANFEHHRLEILWLHQSHNVVDPDLLKAVLASPEPRARAAAVRVLCYWRDRVSDSLDLLRKAAADEHPRVRLEAIRAASFFTEPEAVEVVLVADEKPSDPYLEHIRKETMRALDPHVRAAIAAGKEIRFTTPAGARFFLRNVATEDLLKLKRNSAVYTELLARGGVRDEFRQEAVRELAKDRKLSEVAVLLESLRSQDAAGTVGSAGFDLTRMLTDRPAADLAAIRGELEELATSGKSPLARQLGYVALVAADGSTEKAWATASKSVGGLRDFVDAVPQFRDPGQRAAIYPKLVELLAGLPKDLAATLPKHSGVTGRYVRIELRGKLRTLSLAEVEVFSDGRNVARNGKAKQKNTAFGGDASRGIDGNKSGAYGDGGQTHTDEGTEDPWWEVDLGGEFPIDAIAIYNRTDGSLGSRLKNFAVRVLDASRQPVFSRVNQPTPQESVTIPVGGENPERIVRKAAMLAMTGVRGKETDTFKALAKFVSSDADRPAAVQAIQRIRVAFWPKDEAKPLLETLTAYVKSVPESDRTTPAVLDALQFADGLAGLLPRDDAKAARKLLGQLGVRVIRVGTLTDQMLFDKDRLVVQAGKPVEFVFDNTDIMPHNFVITKMGALEEVGNAAEMFGTQPGAAAKHYVPPSDKILLKSHLLAPRESQILRFAAPAKPGVYPYVCTYPGHWRRMHGALYVVADLDEYLADPEGYLAKNTVPVEDALLKSIRPRTEWKFADLEPSVAELPKKAGRSFANGKHVFQMASCVACHKFGGTGNEFGPDLAKLDAKVFQTPTDLLKHILEPSLRIDDKYRSYTFNLAAGGTVTGMVIEKLGDTYKVIENPLAKAEARVISKDDLDGDPKPSQSSIMPKGLLDKLTKDEILDLLAYILSKADAKSHLFHGAHDHH